MIIVAVTFVAGFLLGELWTVLRSRGSGSNPRERGVVAQVGEHKVTDEEMRGAIAYNTEKYKQENNLRDLATQDYEAIENRTWQWLVSELTWDQLLKKTGVKVTQEEIIEIMRANPPEELRQNPGLLDSAGNFDQQRYLEAMNNEQNQPYFTRYFRELAEMLPKEKLRIDMASSFRVTPGEIAYARRTDGERLSVTSLYFGPRLLPEEPEVPSDEDAKKYFDANRDEFKPQAMRQLFYVSFPLQLTAADSAEAAQTIERARVQLEGGESFNLTMLDFSDLAPETISSYIPRTRLDPKTDSVVRTLSPGRHSTPFLAPYGWQIVALDSVGADSVAVRRILVRIKMSAETVGNARDEVSSFLDLVGEAGFDSLAAAKGLRVTRHRPMYGDNFEVTGLSLVNPGAVSDWLRKAKLGEVMPDPARGSAGYYVFKLAEYRPAVPPEFEEVKHQVTWRVKQQREKQVWIDRAREVLVEIRAGRRLEEFGGEETKVELASETFEGITDCRRRKGPEFAGTVLALEPGQVSGVVETNWGTFIIRVDSREPIEWFDAAGVVQERQQQLSQQIMRGLLETPTVKDYRDPLSY